MNLQIFSYQNTPVKRMQTTPNFCILKFYLDLNLFDKDSIFALFENVCLKFKSVVIFSMFRQNDPKIGRWIGLVRRLSINVN